MGSAILFVLALAIEGAGVTRLPVDTSTCTQPEVHVALSEVNPLPPVLVLTPERVQWGKNEFSFDRTRQAWCGTTTQRKKRQCFSKEDTPDKRWFSVTTAPSRLRIDWESGSVITFTFLKQEGTDWVPETVQPMLRVEDLSTLKDLRYRLSSFLGTRFLGSVETEVSRGRPRRGRPLVFETTLGEGKRFHATCDRGLRELKE